MKKSFYIVILLICSFLFSGVSNANWYGSHLWNTNNSNCNQDGYTDAIPPPNGGICMLAGTFGCLYVVQARIISNWGPGINQCQYWDTTSPFVNANNTSVAWKNANIVVTLSASDESGGSGINTARYMLNGSCFSSGTTYNNGDTTTITTEGTHSLNLCAWDIATNSVINQNFASYKLDKTLPVLNANNNSATWKNTTIPITHTATDVLYSGLNNPFTKYRFDNADCVSGGTVFSNGFINNYNTEGDHTLYLCARDNAGNTQTWTGQYRIDTTQPYIVPGSIHYASLSTNGWTNSTNINISWSAADPMSGSPSGSSGLKNYDIAVYRTTSQNNPTALDHIITIPAATTTTNYTYPATNGYSYRFEIIPRDNAGNTGVAEGSSEVARIDTVNPVASSITSTTATDLLANNAQTFNYTYNDGGAPVQFDYYFEQNAVPGTFGSLTTTLGYSAAMNFIGNISSVDNAIGVNGGRPYSMRITRICDWANNCVNGTFASPLHTLTYNIYANTTLASATSSATSITDGSAEADGSPHLFTMSVADTYTNQIVPATGISRTINMGLSSISNSMYLNQHTRAGATSVYVTAPDNTPDDPLSFATTQSFASPITTVTTGDYPLAIKVYTPTASSYLPSEPASDNSANFGFDTNIIASDTLAGSRTFTQSIGAPIFRPLFTTDITGDLENGGFIEGTEQSSTISFTHNSGVNPSGTSLQLEFSGALASSFTLSGADITANMAPISTLADMAPSPIFSNTTLTTKLTQNPNITVNGTSDIQLSTHIKYVLDGKNVLYNSDIIGKIGGYWGGTTTQLGNQAGVKIIGAISSNNISSIVTNQFSTGTSIFDGVSRADVRNSVRRSVALAIRNAQLSPYSSTISTFTSLDPGADLMGTRIVKDANTSITYIKKNGGTVTLGSVAPVIGVSGRRTLVVEGADLYINRDLYYTSPDSILGVVVQKDANGVGGNLYIDPDITNIVGSYVIDGSVMSSSDGINPIGSSNIFSLKNQLYIHGSLVSENTIGGSRSYPLKCPSLIPPSLCNTTELAQRYDLNYLRRYYLYNGIPFGSGFGGTKVIGGGTCTSSCSGFGVLATKFTMPTDDLAKYPVIIEYNPAIRGNPPIGFEENAD